jgi:hypothetical protein
MHLGARGAGGEFRIGNSAAALVPATIKAAKAFAHAVKTW